MKIFPWSIIIGLLLPGVLPPSAVAQPVTPSRNTPAFSQLFESDTILELTLKGDLRPLLKDRIDEPQNHAMILTCPGYDSAGLGIQVMVKTRGHFRRLKGNCLYPPLQIQFPKKDITGTDFFKGASKIKLVMPCQGEEYVIYEWLVYKIYNLVTTESLKARLVKIALVDEKHSGTIAPVFGILLEEEKEMAKRNEKIALEKKLKPEQLVPETYYRLAIFEFLIANTDWSVEYLQNIKLIGQDSSAVPSPVPYDFDHAGIVNAPYALPASELELSSVRERRYRGYCIKDLALFDSTISFYNRLRPAIYRLYSECRLISPRYIKTTLNYLDEFYATINNRKTLARAIQYPCRTTGTGNVIIKGLKKPGE